jgi:O-acetyl-ADP-ribose deacetylase (regulator of RNase III)
MECRFEFLRNSSSLVRKAVTCEATLLVSTTKKCLAKSADANARGLAFPAISTGIFRFPSELAAEIAVRETRAVLKLPSSLERVVFVAFDAHTEVIYRQILSL